MFNQLRGIVERLQIDRSLAYVLASRIWQGLSGPITILFVVSFLSRDQQGVYYGVFSFVAIQAFFELGLLNILVGYAGHEAAGLESEADEERREQAARRMSELIRASNVWFAIASLLFAIVALAFGWYTLAKTELDSPVAWQLPFAIVVPCAALTVYFAPRMAILEGAGFRESIYRYRFFQAVSGSLAVWISLALGAGIWCLVAATATQTLWAWYISRFRFRDFFDRFTSLVQTATDFSWARDVVPAQWRMALISLLHHVTSQCFTIIVLLFHQNAADAGRLGMTLTVTGAIQMLALAWVQTKYPVAAALHGSGEREAAGTMWRRTAAISTSILIAGFAVFILLVVVLPAIDRRFEARFILPSQIAILGVGCLASHLLAVQGFYVLARRIDPLLITVPGLVLAAAAVWAAGYVYSIQGIVVAYAICITLVVLPMHTWAYLTLRSDDDSVRA
ncbi:hypothetical protein CA51_06180 [Rosistilla oblonga]|uniref:hypothetical protein n=1 Tax=Rosistilla oblonga TaxID=2527990 RepID=UPI00118C2689|nr:hypothetical protein [Rosistilla oblonga]QDV10764.1 hypothetical protein CA51_06180 [Rosistilla oblonga]